MDTSVHDLTTLHHKGVRSGEILIRSRPKIIENGICSRLQAFMIPLSLEQQMIPWNSKLNMIQRKKQQIEVWYIRVENCHNGAK